MFIVLKRPIYEAMLFGYIVMIAVTNQWANFFVYMWKTSTNTLFYAIVAFLAAAQVFGGTKVIDKVIEIVLSIVIRCAAISVGFGLIAMYLKKEKALSLTTEKKAAEEELAQIKSEEQALEK